ncbi:MAG: cytochrome c-type biogenesis protein [Pseudomonadales bacterium]|nr:cytochrome c-type biogenesis protein [Pseudomonadales bacterium]
MTKFFLLFVLTCSLPGQAWAAIEVHEFDSPEQEARFRHLIDEMRCPMCLNANLSGSDAPIAADLRHEIADQIAEGRSDEEIIAFMTSRYGDFILYRPPLNSATFFLWFGPALLLLAGFFVVRRMLRQSRAATTESALSADESNKLHAILDSDSDTKK